MKSIKKFFSSLKTAIFLICLLTLLAIVGTFIPQRLEAINYVNAFPKTYHFILGLGFDDMYRCNLFIGTLLLLSISSLTCVIVRWKSFHNKIFNRLDNISIKEIMALKVIKSIERAPEEKILSKYSIVNLSDGRKIAFSSSGKASLLGGLILHIGLVLIFFGGLLGLLFGVEMSISGKAGEKIPVPSIDVIKSAYKADNMSRKARQIRQFSPMNPELELMRAEIEKLHTIYNEGIMHPEFKIAFDKLWMEHYSDKDGVKRGVKSWNVELRFIDIASGSLFNETTQTSAKVIKVNEPVNYKEWNFYLANWNKYWEKIKIRIDYVPNVKGFEFYKPEKNDISYNIEVGITEPFMIKDFPYTLYISEFYPDFRTSNGINFSASSDLKNPVAKIIAYNQQTNEIIGHEWAFSDKNNAMMQINANGNNLPFKFVFENAESNYEAILQMAYDPGVPFVWIGCFVFCLGMLLSFYISYREEWVVINADGTAIIALNSNRATKVLEKELPAFEKKLTQ